MNLWDNNNEQVIEYIQTISKKYFIAPEISVDGDSRDGCAVSIRNAIPMYDCDIMIGIAWGKHFDIFYYYDLKQVYSDDLDDSVFKLLNDFNVKASTRYVAKIEKDLGVIDILVNNAGIIKRIPMCEMDVKDFKEVIDIDLVAPYIVAKNCIPQMIKKGHGKIINICSMMSELGRETVSAYASAKGGLKMLTKNICSEFVKSKR